MRAVGRLATFGAGLIVLFGASMQLGDAVGPIGDSGSSTHDDHGVESTSEHGDLAPGTQITSDGLTMVTSDRTLPAGGNARFRFQIVSENGLAHRSFELDHTVRMHLVLVKRDLSGFQHLHPVMSPRGTWTAEVAPLEPGSYRALAEFTPAAHEHDSDHGSTVLGVDVDVPGLFEPQALPAPADTAQVGPYTAQLEGRLVPGTSSVVRMTVRENGEPVPDLQPFLGVPAHLVVLRTGDLAYLHVHPVTTETVGPGQVVFEAEVPTAGTYRLFLEFRHRDTVHRAEFTVDAQPAEDGHDHGH